MNERITALNIADELAVQLTFPKHVADTFVRSFVDTIIEGLTTDGIVKVKGLGTFRIVEVDSRESVSVTTGERIVIPSFKKVTFTPEESVAERMSGIEAEPAVQTDEAVDVPSVEEFFSVIAKGEEAEAQTPETEDEPCEENPSDQFSGIDVLISTPESLEELHDRLAEALKQQEEAQRSVAAAQANYDRLEAMAQIAKSQTEQEQERAHKADDEVAQIQQLIENVESNRRTELAATTATAEAPDTPLSSDTPEETTTTEPAAEVAPLHLPQTEGEPPTNEEEQALPTGEDSGGAWWRIPLILLVLLIVGAACYFVAVNPKQPLRWLNLDQKETPAQPKPEPAAQPKPAAKPEPKDTIVVEPVVTPEPKPQVEEPKQEKPAEPARPKTHKIRRGDTLTKISLQYYGTKDSVRAIIRANNFKDPNNISEGAVVKLP